MGIILRHREQISPEMQPVGGNNVHRAHTSHQTQKYSKSLLTEAGAENSLYSARRNEKRDCDLTMRTQWLIYRAIEIKLGLF